MPTDPTSSSAWEPPSLEELHELLPQYEITAMLGRGGMGAVYKGRQTKLNRDVAIKLLPETFTQGDDEMNFAARFEQEAQAMAGLNHPAIIAVYDFGETANGQLYFVMEFVDGLDIHQYLKQSGDKLPQEDALAITAHVLDALEYAHQNGIVHRDIKPANILLDSQGRVKIADFGLAKRSEGQGEGAGLTMSNVALGTPDFVAPEALDAEKTPDHRADLYAVGVMLYQMLTGSIPRGNFKLPSSLIPEIDPRVDSIIERSLESDPEDRYSSASEIRSALDPIFSTPITKAEGGASKEEPAPVSLGAADVVEIARKKSKSPLMIGLGAAAALLVGGAIWMVSGGGEKKVEALAATNASPEKLAEKEPEEEVPKMKEKEPSEVAKTKAPPMDSSTPPAEREESTAKSEPESVEPAPEMEEDLASPQMADAKAEPSEEAKPAPETPEPEPEAATETGVDYAAIPNLYPRLNRYLDTRSARVGGLATSYLRALDGKLDAAADAGNLQLARAFESERKQVTELQASLQQTPADPVAALSESATLKALPASSPADLVSLRNTWTAERGKIEDSLNTQLQQSLTFLEQELTRGRNFDGAEAVLNLRESLIEAPPMLAEESKESSEETPSENGPQVPASVETPPRIQGRLRAKGTFTDGKPIDLSAAADFIDIVEVHYHGSGFLARRANGQVVSNFKILPEPPAQVMKIVRSHASGYQALFGLIDSEDRFTLHRAVNTPLPEVAKSEGVRDAALSEKIGLTIHLDGTLGWFGEFYEETTDLAMRWKDPPKEAQTEVKSAVAIGDWAAVLREDGDIVAWNREGEIRLPRDFARDAVLMGRAHAYLYALDDKGDLRMCELKVDPSATRQPVLNDPDITAFSELLARLMVRNKDGVWKVIREGDLDYGQLEEISQLPDLEPNQFAYDWDPANGIDLLLWIDPNSSESSVDLTNLENPFGWKEIDRDPFPLSRPDRPNVPCHVVAWRLDGQPVNGEAFKATYGFLPHEMGEVVDFDLTPVNVGIKSASFLQENGDVVYTTFDSKTPTGVVRFEGKQIVQLDQSQTTIAMLDVAGKPHFVFPDPVMASNQDLDFTAAESWSDLASIAAGFNYVLGLTQEGKPLSIGSNRVGQTAFPSGLSENLVLLKAFGEATWAISLSGREYLGKRFGRVNNALQAKHGERFFIDTQFFVTNDRGDVRTGGGESDMSTYYRKAPRDLADVQDIAAMSYPKFPDAGIVAARTDQSTWYFWGEREEEGLPFDPDLMQEKAEGAFKLLFDGDYLLALKPVGTLDADDWTGEGSENSTTVSATSATASFPLPVPKRPEVAGRLEIHRLDARPVGSQETDNNLANLPEGMASNVVSIDVGWRTNGPNDVNTMAVALLKDGTVRVWESEGIHSRKISQNPTLGITDVVQAAAGDNAVILLKSDGTVWATGHSFGGFNPDKLQQIDTGGEKAVMVDLMKNNAYVLTETGRVFIANRSQIIVPEDLPPSLQIAASVNGGFALGVDGIWRAWKAGEQNGAVSGQTPSNGLRGAPSNFPDQVRWVDQEGKFRFLHLDGRIGADQSLPPAINCFANAQARGVEISPGEWIITSPEPSHGNRRNELEKAIQGLTGITSTRVYLFGIRPLGR